MIVYAVIIFVVLLIAYSFWKPAPKPATSAPATTPVVIGQASNGAPVAVAQTSNGTPVIVGYTSNGQPTYSVPASVIAAGDPNACYLARYPDVAVVWKQQGHVTATGVADGKLHYDLHGATAGYIWGC